MNRTFVFGIIALVVGAGGGFGAYLGIAWGVLIVGLAVFAVRQERQTAMAVSFVMGVCGCSWVLSVPSALLLGLAPSLLWLFAGVAYAMSLKVGEPV